jgi:hypothetical protein
VSGIVNSAVQAFIRISLGTDMNSAFFRTARVGPPDPALRPGAILAIS